MKTSLIRTVVTAAFAVAAFAFAPHPASAACLDDAKQMLDSAVGAPAHHVSPGDENAVSMGQPATGHDRRRADQADRAGQAFLGCSAAMTTHSGAVYQAMRAFQSAAKLYDEASASGSAGSARLADRARRQASRAAAAVLSDRHAPAAYRMAASDQVCRASMCSRSQVAAALGSSRAR